MSPGANELQTMLLHPCQALVHELPLLDPVDSLSTYQFAALQNPMADNVKNKRKVGNQYERRVNIIATGLFDLDMSIGLK